MAQLLKELLFHGKGVVEMFSIISLIVTDCLCMQWHLEMTVKHFKILPNYLKQSLVGTLN